MADTVAQPSSGGVESFAHRLHAHAPSHATHTIELQQVIEINRHISSGAFEITAAQIGVDHPAASGASLRHVHLEGSPTFPYIYGVFDLAAHAAGVPGVPLQTAQLQAISKAMHLHHHWV